MADESNTSTPPAEDSVPAVADPGQPATTGDDVSSTTVDPAEQARRDQQSQKDKAKAEASDKDEKLDFLLARESERLRNETVDTFLTENKDKYPNVTKEDLRFANSKDEIKELADHVQNRFKTLQQDALKSVQVQPDKGLSAEEFAEREKQLEEDQSKTGKSQFGNFMDAVRRKK